MTFLDDTDLHLIIFVCRPNLWTRHEISFVISFFFFTTLYFYGKAFILGYFIGAGQRRKPCQ
jgi:hypothetical protein